MINMRNKKIKAYQIYYDESQKDLLMDGFIPYLNTKATVNLESGIICDLVNRGECSNCDWFGIFSWKASEKVREFNFKRLQKEVIDNSECDIIGPNPKNYIHCARRIKSPHTIRFKKHRFMNAFEPLIKKLGISENPSDFMTEDFKMIYFNYFIAKPKVYKHFVDSMLNPAISLFREDSELHEIGMTFENYRNQTPPSNFKKDTGLMHYPRIPFILERLINVYIHLNNMKVGYVI